MIQHCCTTDSMQAAVACIVHLLGVNVDFVDERESQNLPHMWVRLCRTPVAA